MLSTILPWILHNVMTILTLCSQSDPCSQCFQAACNIASSCYCSNHKTIFLSLSQNIQVRSMNDAIFYDLKMFNLNSTDVSEKVLPPRPGNNLRKVQSSCHLDDIGFCLAYSANLKMRAAYPPKRQLPMGYTALYPWRYDSLWQPLL